MKRDQLKNHSMVHGKNLVPRIVEGFTSVPKSKEQHFYELIYSCVDGQISGDLAMFLGDNANPEVVAYIQQNLLGSHSAVGASTLPDDEQLAMSRRFGEDAEEYGKRMYEYFQSKNKSETKTD